MQTHRIPKTVEPTASRSAYEYELSRINYTEGSDVWVERENRKYIYVLFSASKQSLPFYVGQTANLAKRFSKHGEISWHYGKYSRKTIVHVIASVPNYMATEAEKQTIKTLTNKGFILNNSSLNSDNLNPFKHLTPKEMRDLLGKVKDINTVTLFKTMRKYWLQQESQIVADNTNTNELTKTELLRKVKQRKYANNQSRSLSLQLADKYSQKEKASTYSFIGSDAKTEDEMLALAIAQFKGLMGDWYLKDSNIILGQPLKFYPSDGLLAAKAQTPSYGTRPASKKETTDWENKVNESTVVKPILDIPEVLSEEDMYKEKVRNFLSTVTRLEMMKAIQALYPQMRNDEERKLAMKVAGYWAKAHLFSSYKAIKKTNTSSIRHFWFYGQRKEFSAFKQFYPTKVVVETLLAQKRIKL
jgi:predicted GIY-YIG superfamily endonuclease